MRSCKNYDKGYCKYGDRCIHTHTKVKAAKSESLPNKALCPNYPKREGCILGYMCPDDHICSKIFNIGIPCYMIVYGTPTTGSTSSSDYKIKTKRGARFDDRPYKPSRPHGSMNITYYSNNGVEFYQDAKCVMYPQHISQMLVSSNKNLCNIEKAEILFRTYVCMFEIYKLIPLIEPYDIGQVILSFFHLNNLEPIYVCDF